MQQLESGSINQRINFAAFQHEGEYDYTTKRSGFVFKFILQKVSGVVRIYITQQPSYAGRSENLHETHRIKDSERNAYFVCTDPNNPPTNIQDACTWLVMWAEGTDAYIRTGEFIQVAP